MVDNFLAFEESCNRLPGFSYEVQGVHQEKEGENVRYPVVVVEARLTGIEAATLSTDLSAAQRESPGDLRGAGRLRDAKRGSWKSPQAVQPRCSQISGRLPLQVDVSGIPSRS
jgi:hypothetical protein